jgi:pilus assembly protein CpaE
MSPTLAATFPKLEQCRSDSKSLPRAPVQPVGTCIPRVCGKRFASARVREGHGSHDEHGSITARTAPIVACTISRNVQNFDLLIEDMESELGESWGDLFRGRGLFLQQPDSDGLEFVAIAMARRTRPISPHRRDHQGGRGEEDQGDRDRRRGQPDRAAPAPQARRAGIRALPPARRRAARRDRADAAPVPLGCRSGRTKLQGDRRPGRRRAAGPGIAGGTAPRPSRSTSPGNSRTSTRRTPPRVCLIDLDLQFGSTSTYLDLPRREAVLELLSDTPRWTTTPSCRRC